MRVPLAVLAASLLACVAPASFVPPATDGDGIMILATDTELFALAWPAGLGLGVVSLPVSPEPRLWLEYPAGSLGNFIEPGLQRSVKLADDGDPGRPLPDPTALHARTNDGWQRLQLTSPRAEPDFAAFRWPSIDPFDCAKKGGCYDVSLPDLGGYPTCGPCPAAAAPTPPEPPEPPRFRPCQEGWIEAELAGAEICEPPPPCALDGPPWVGPCDVKEDCLAALLPDGVATGVWVDASDGSVAGRHSDLGAAIRALSGAGASSATIALGAGSHFLDGAGSLTDLTLRGLCPVRTSLQLALPFIPRTPGSGPPGRWSIRDVSLGRVRGTGPERLVLSRVLGDATPKFIDAGELTLEHSAFEASRLEFAGDQHALRAVRMLGGTLSATVTSMRMSEVAFTQLYEFHVSSNLDLRNARVELADGFLSCQLPRLPAHWNLRDVSITTPWSLHLLLDGCSFSGSRIAWRGAISSEPPRPGPQVHYNRSFVLEDSALAQVHPSFNAFAGDGDTTLRRIKAALPVNQVFSLDKVNATVEDVDFESTTRELQYQNNTEALTLSPSGTNSIHRMKVSGFASRGLGVRREGDDPPGAMGRTQIEDVSLIDPGHGGLLLRAADVTIDRLSVVSPGGSGILVSDYSKLTLSNASVVGAKPSLDGCIYTGRGASCEGGGLHATTDADVDLQRFEIEAAIGMEIGGASVRAREGRVKAEVLGFNLDRSLLDPRLLLGHVRVEAPEIAKQVGVDQ